VTQQGWTRRRVLAAGVGGFVGVAFAGLELVEHGVLPGKRALDELAGGCSISAPPLTFAPAEPSHSGQFFSAGGSAPSATRSRIPQATRRGASFRWRSCSTGSVAITPADSAA